MAIKEEEALNLARKSAIFNSEVIYNIKNSLMLMTNSLQKQMKDDREKFKIIVKTKYPHVEPDMILATTTNNNNHDLTKIDVGLITDMFLEEDDDESRN